MVKFFLAARSFVCSDLSELKKNPFWVNQAVVAARKSTNLDEEKSANLVIYMYNQSVLCLHMKNTYYS